MMPMEQIEDLKQKYTDKYVMVDADRPELARFRDHVGQVKTVNMSGRALVQFADYHLNIGWYDIGLNYLKVVDKPDLTAKKPVEKKPAPAKKPAAAAEAKPAAPPKAGGKPSVADILAAARGGAAKPAASPPAAKKETAPKAAAPAAKVDPKKMSTADILAMARGGKSTEPTAKAPAEETAVEEPAAAPAEPEPVVEEAKSAPAAKESAGLLDKSAMSIDQMVAYCREHDAE